MAITTIGQSQSFGYTGGIQTFTVPFNGLYKLDVRGAKGGKANDHQGTYGRNAVGYIKLKKGEILYVVCGGAGANDSTGWSSGDFDPYSYTVAGGYNGGGNGYAYGTGNYWQGVGAGGGGATHIARQNGLLKSISDSNILIVASGGAGSAVTNTNSEDNGIKASSSISTNGTQGQGSSGSSNGNSAIGGGGGGYRGGNASYVGSCLIDRTPSITIDGKNYSPSTSTSSNTNGSAIITYIAKISSFGFVGDKEISNLRLGDKEISSLKIG